MEHENPERVLEISGTISEAALRGSEIVQQLLAFARKSDGHVAPSDLNRYLQANLQALKERVPAEVELVFEPTASLPNIMADSSQVDRILINLITNSVDAMPEGGRLTISTRLVSATELPNVLPELSSEKLRLHDDQRHGQGHRFHDARARLRAVLHHEGTRGAAPAWACPSSTAWCRRTTVTST